MWYDDHGLLGTTWSILIICVFDLCEVLAYLSKCQVMDKYVCFLCMLGDHVTMTMFLYV